MCFEVDQPQNTQPAAPAARDYATETRDTLQAKLDLAPKQYESDAEYRKKYAQLDTDILKQTAPEVLSIYRDLYPQLGQLQSQANTDQRAGDIADVEQLGPRATAAIRAANPQATAMLDSLNADANNAGPSDFEKELSKQLMQELTAGGYLTPDQLRQAQQDSRISWNDRGLVYSPAAAGAELLNVDSARTARRQTVQNAALTFDQWANARQNSDRAFKGNVASLNYSTASDPFMTILSRPSMVPGAAQATFGSSGYSLNSGPKLFDPESGYAQDIYNTNYNAEAASNIAGANNNAAIYGANQMFLGQLYGAGIQAAGSIAGGAIARCWVAIELYGKDHEKTHRIRAFVTKHENDADWLGDFCRLYVEKGPEWAGQIRGDAKSRKKAWRFWDMLDAMARAENN